MSPLMLGFGTEGPRPDIFQLGEFGGGTREVTRLWFAHAIDVPRN